MSHPLSNPSSSPSTFGRALIFFTSSIFTSLRVLQIPRHSRVWVDSTDKRDLTWDRRRWPQEKSHPTPTNVGEMVRKSRAIRNSMEWTSLDHLCYRNPLGGWEQWTGVTLIVGRLVRAQYIRFCFLFACFRCSWFHLLVLLVSLGVPPSWFCSSTAELHLCLVLYASFTTSFFLRNLLLRMLFLSLALLVPCLPLFYYGLCCEVPTTLYIQHLSLYRLSS